MRRFIHNLVIGSLLAGSTTPAIAQIVPDFQVNDNGGVNGADQAAPRLANGNGIYVAVWEDRRNGLNVDIFGQLYTEDGTPVGENFRLNDDNGTALQYRSDVAMAADGDFCSTWLDRRSEGWDWDLYLQRYDELGMPQGGNLLVNDDQSEAEQEHGRVAWSDAGGVVVWADERQGDWLIYAQRYTVAGEPLGTNFPVTGNDVYTEYWPVVALTADGGFIVVWSDNREGLADFSVFGRRFDAAGDPVGNEFRVNDAQGDSQILAELECNDDGCVVAWMDKRNGEFQIYAQRYNAAGEPLGANLHVDPVPQDWAQRFPTLALAAGGGFVVAWNDERGEYTDIYARRFDAAGEPLGESFCVNTAAGDCYHGYPAVASVAAGEFCIVWEDHRRGDKGEIFAQRYSGGETAGENFLVNDDVGSSNQNGPALARNSDAFLIAWTDERRDWGDIFAQRFDNTATPLEGNFQVCDADSGSGQCSAAAGMAAAGNFVLVWEDYRNGYIGDVYGQCFATDGVPHGSNFRVNEETGAVCNCAPAIGMRAAGDFLIAWNDLPLEETGRRERSLLRRRAGREENDADILAQLYTADGTPTGDNFMVNDDDGYTDQSGVAAAAHPGGYILTWQDGRNDGWIGDIFAQRLDTAGTPLDDNFQVNTDAVGAHQRDPAVAAAADGGCVIAWSDNRAGVWDTFAQRINGEGIPLGDNFQVNDNQEPTHETFPAVALTADGGFLISWTDRREGTTAIYARCFDAGGQSLGASFRLTSADGGCQSAGAVTIWNSRIYSTWEDNRGGQTGFDIWANVLDWEEPHAVVVGFPVGPLRFRLHGNHPNPFNAITHINCELPRAGELGFAIYNLNGQLLERRQSSRQPAGEWRTSFDAGPLPSGVDIYEIQFESERRAGRMLLVK